MDAALPLANKQPLPTEALKETLNALLRIIPADMVFCKDLCLYIVPGTAAPHSMHEYKVMLDSADWNRTGFTWTLYELEDIRKGIDEGKLFYNTAFSAQWLVYDNGRSALPLPLPLRVAQTERHGREAFAFGYRQSQIFYRCAAALTAAEEAGVAAFMLHQAAEQLLRGFIIAVTGQEVKTHTLADLMRHTLRYAPAIKLCRTHSGETLHWLSERLEKAYTGGRYSPHFHIATAALPELCTQVIRLQEAVKEAFSGLMEGYGLYTGQQTTTWHGKQLHQTILSRNLPK